MFTQSSVGSYLGQRQPSKIMTVRTEARYSGSVLRLVCFYTKIVLVHSSGVECWTQCAFGLVAHTSFLILITSRCLWHMQLWYTTSTFKSILFIIWLCWNSIGILAWRTMPLVSKKLEQMFKVNFLNSKAKLKALLSTFFKPVIHFLWLHRRWENEGWVWTLHVVLLEGILMLGQVWEGISVAVFCV